MIAIMSGSLFDGLAVRSRELDAGQVLFNRGTPVRAMYSIADGLVELQRRREDGGVLVLQRAGPGSILAEASLFSRAYHCDAVVRQSSVVHSVSVGAFKAKLRDPAFAEAWMMRLSHEVQATRMRAEILSLRTVADRLSAWLDLNGSRPQQEKWVDVAAEIGVSPEALYRELSARRKGQRA